MFWGTVAKILGTIIAGKNSSAGNTYRMVSGMVNSARSNPQPQANKM